VKEFSYSQSPQFINYQGIVRDIQNVPIGNKLIQLRLSLQSNSNTIYYSETQIVTTNSSGLFSIRIGQGSPVNGAFGSIPWNFGDKYLKVEVDVNGGNNFQQLGTPEILSSVPYSLFASTAAEIVLSGDINGKNTSTFISALQGNPISAQTPTAGEVLKWNGAMWQPGTDATSGGGSYSAGQGISISNNLISNIGDLSNTNELQQISLSNNNLSLSNGGGTVTLPSGSNYSAGNGISIMGNIINNIGDVDNTNEIQQLSITGNTLLLSNGGGSVNLPSGSGNYWESFGGNDITNSNTGTVFVGNENVPFEALFAASSNNSSTISVQNNGTGKAILAQASNGTVLELSGLVALRATGTGASPAGTFNNYSGDGIALQVNGGLGISGGYENYSGTISKADALANFKFGGGLSPGNNNFYDIGSSDRRWKNIYATNGTINTSDERQKQKIIPLNYGLSQVLAMRPVSFEWKMNPEQGRKIGFLAQDLLEIIPEVVVDKEWVRADEHSDKLISNLLMLLAYIMQI